MNTPDLSARVQLARKVRERFVDGLVQGAPVIVQAVQQRLNELLAQVGNAREQQTRQDAWTTYKQAASVWQDNTTKAWRGALKDAPTAKAREKSTDTLELVGEDVFENKILTSRLVMSVMDKIHEEYDDLRLRVRYLEGVEDLAEFDVLRPDVPTMVLVEQWSASGMPAQAWILVSEAVQAALVGVLSQSYQHCNAALVQKGVMPRIALSDRVKAPRIQRSPAGAVGAAAPEPHGLAGPQASAPPHGVPAAGGYAPAAGGFGGPSSPPVPNGSPFWHPSAGAGVPSGNTHGSAYGAPDSVGATSATPLARARARAQGVLGQIRRFFVSHAGGDLVGPRSLPPPTPGLMVALAQQGASFEMPVGRDQEMDYGPAGMAYVATQLREKSTALKEKAETKGEKATIEIVALMFQAILAEDRIPPGIRVWIARLQMPVLRVALEDPEFLGTTTHPARMLIDRMGSVVMGFDAAGGHGASMEQEIKRVVQVVEQYPETGKKVYQVVYEEFEKFLSKFLTEKGPAKEVVSVAQQVEQKETLAIQYTIEMRNMLRDMPVRDEIRSFLFKVWAEVLAVAAVRKGPQHADTLTLKKTATDLVWSASAKPSRTERAKVIQELPHLLLRLRTGMTLLGVPPAEQEAHIKSVSDTLQDAFLSKTQVIGQDKIDALATRLGNLEDFIAEDGLGDLPLDAESIEMMLGVDAAGLEVVANGGSKPTAAMIAWASELQVGSWYRMKHGQQLVSVQLVWRSERKHLNLFSAMSGSSFLVQAGRLAAYLQAGLLMPQEEESLTVRATRDALSKLENQPERATV